MKKKDPYDLDSLLCIIYNGLGHNIGIVGKVMTSSEWVEFWMDARREVRQVYSDIRSLTALQREAYLKQRYEKYYKSLKTET